MRYLISFIPVLNTVSLQSYSFSKTNESWKVAYFEQKKFFIKDIWTLQSKLFWSLSKVTNTS